MLVSLPERKWYNACMVVGDWEGMKRFETVLSAGENSTIEFKRCGGKVEHDVFESVCSFLNRFGGDIFLGVENDGTVRGVATEAVPELKRQIVMTLNDPNVFKPTPYVELSDFEWDGKTIVRVRVPVSGDVHYFRNEVYDRINEVDVVVRTAEQISEMFMRKRNVYTERQVIPSLGMADLRLDMLKVLRKEAQNNFTSGRNHPWMQMNDEELLKNSSLIGYDPVTGKTGLNLACVLLLGKDDVIRQICPQYETDAIVKVQNVERYDDRLIVQTNLLDAYGELMRFGREHLPDPFFLEGDIRISLREIILREMISNMLIHREYTASLASQFVVEKDRFYTTNPCKPFQDARITPENVRPRAKNPIVAGFFRELGRADRLGSGVRNLYKYAKAYGGADPIFVEGNEFVTSVGLKKGSFESEKVMIGPEEVSIEPEKGSFGDEKVSIGSKEVLVDGEKVLIDQIIESLDIAQPTRVNLKKLRAKIAEMQVFGRSEVMRITEVESTRAGQLLALMLKNRMIEPVKGHGKGRYRWVHG